MPLNKNSYFAVLTAQAANAMTKYLSLLEKRNSV